MTKALILAAHMIPYRNFIIQYGLDANEYRYIPAHGGWGDVYGFHWDTPVIMLEGYEYNRNYTLGFMKFVGARFHNIGFLSDGERWNEDVSI
jgi:hypothetical protein